MGDLGLSWGDLWAVSGCLGTRLGAQNIDLSVFFIDVRKQIRFLKKIDSLSDLGAVLGRLGVVLGRSWALLELSWPLLEDSWGPLGAILAALGSEPVVF